MLDICDIMRNCPLYQNNDIFCNIFYWNFLGVFIQFYLLDFNFIWKTVNP